jgi:hypothetical protein
VLDPRLQPLFDLMVKIAVRDLRRQRAAVQEEDDLQESREEKVPRPEVSQPGRFDKGH